MDYLLRVAIPRSASRKGGFPFVYNVRFALFVPGHRRYQIVTKNLPIWLVSVPTYGILYIWQSTRLSGQKFSTISAPAVADTLSFGLFCLERLAALTADQFRNWTVRREGSCRLAAAGAGAVSHRSWQRRG